jgi:hypothetical protein
VNQTEFAMAVARLFTAITDEAGGLRPVSRVEFEIIGHQVRWSLWEGSTRLHTLTDRAKGVPGFLAATKLLLELRAEDVARRL